MSDPVQAEFAKLIGTTATGLDVVTLPLNGGCPALAVSWKDADGKEWCTVACGDTPLLAAKHCAEYATSRERAFPLGTGETIKQSLSRHLDPDRMP